MESLLLSSMDGPSKTVSLVADEDYDYRDTSIELTTERFILRRWEIRDDSVMLPFFRITHGNYVRLTNADSTVSAESLKEKVSIEFIADKAVRAYGRIFIPVKITNRSGRKIPSLPVDQNYLSVQVQNAQKNFVSDIPNGESEIPLDIDLGQEYSEVISCKIDNLNAMRIFVQLKVGKAEIASASVELK